jgi:hypothetical protein
VDEVLDDLRGRRIFRLEDFQAGRFSGAGQEIGKAMTKQLNIWPHTVSPGCDALSAYYQRVLRIPFHHDAMYQHSQGAMYHTDVVRSTTPGWLKGH